ncbi:MAG: hypothetical protein ACI8XB_000686 [Patiriisocius sp.]|jgi:subtilisin-like proprotein convertase family protein
MNIHHTWISYLEMWLVSPSNDSLLLFDGYDDQALGTGLFPGGLQFGGMDFGTYSGLPINDGSNYCFSLTSINSLETVLGQGYSSMPEGYYLPMGDVNNLQGSLVNGDWTLFVGDYFQQDEGYIYNWYIDFSEELITAAPDYEPVLLDSYWNGYTEDVLELTPTEIGQFNYEIIVSDDYDCTFEKTLTLTVLNPDCTVGVDDFESEVIQVYPNPSDGIFNINVADNVLSSISIYNELGDVVLTKENLRSQTYIADLTMHANGLYLGQILTQDGKSLLFKVLKK